MRKLMFLLLMCLLAISARFERMKLLQLRWDAMEQLHILRSAEVALEIPLTGHMTWEDMLDKK